MALTIFMYPKRIRLSSLWCKVHKIFLTFTTTVPHLFTFFNVENAMPLKLQFTSFLRTWIAVLAFMALGNTLQCFYDPRFLGTRVYTQSTSNALTSNVFGCWSFMLASLRFCCAIDIYNLMVYNLTILSFVVLIGHFVAEIFYYKTALLSSAVIVQLIISGLTVLGMIFGYTRLDKSSGQNQEVEEETLSRRQLLRLSKHKRS